MTGFHSASGGSIFNLQFSFPGLFAFICSLLLMSSVAESTAQMWHTVRWVNDGDTVVLTTGHRIRYIGLNAPEIDHEDQKAQPHGYQARAFNKNLVLSQRIKIRFNFTENGPHSTRDMHRPKNASRNIGAIERGSWT
jgi:endonuclease YncB( thermonuclease family)